MGIDTVEADAHGIATGPPVELEQGGDDVVAGLLLVGGCDGVFEVEEDVVRLARERLGEHRRLRAGHGELAPLQPGLDPLLAPGGPSPPGPPGGARLPPPGLRWGA